VPWPSPCSRLLFREPVRESPIFATAFSGTVATARPDKALEDETVTAAPQQQPTAAEMSKKESVASAFLRGLQYQEYEVRSAAEAMPEEKYGYRPAEGKFKMKSHNSALPRFALSRNR